MVRITFLDVELDNTKEHEIKTDSEFGFIVEVFYNTNFSETFNNVTEVHFRYPSFIKNVERVAFESNIHFTGVTRNLTEISTINIDINDKIGKNFCTYGNKIG
jgi:hypothetical protein